MNDNEIVCTVTVEKYALLSNGQNKRVYKNTKATIGRNEFRDLILKVDTVDGSHKLSVTNKTLVHKRFVKEGKASLGFPNEKITLFFSNCPPNKLSTFIKVILAKLDKIEPIATPRTRLTYNKRRGFTEISPVVLLKKENDSSERLVSRGTTRPTLKRQREEDNENLRNAPKRSNSSTDLTDRQREILQMVKSGKNVFITGSAGTGKSFLLKKVIGILAPESTFVTASTAVAACQIGGTTLHSFAGMGDGTAHLDKCLRLLERRAASAQWQKCLHLIIDEISTINGDYFEKLEKVARRIRKCERPFGGIQLILCGDFFQLPPVSNETKAKFCFQTNAWRKCNFLYVQLSQVHRQSEPEFVRILQDIRLGRCNEETTKILRGTASQKIDRNDVMATRLCTHKKDYQLINEKRLNELPGTTRIFTATDKNESFSDYIDRQCPAPRQLRLKVGCQVMLTKNLSVRRGLVNGARGVVTKFENGIERLPTVKFVSGVEQVIKYERWTVKSPGSLLLSRQQLPLELAWAISIHKSQGMTLDCVEMNLSNVFEVGQAYVALSRAKNLQGLRVIDFEPKSVRADSNVLKFYETLPKIYLQSTITHFDIE